MKELIYNFNLQYVIWIPEWACEERLRPCNKWAWYLRRLMFFRWKVNPYHGFLVQLNHWTESKDFEEDYTRETTWIVQKNVRGVRSKI